MTPYVSKKIYQNRSNRLGGKEYEHTHTEIVYTKIGNRFHFAKYINK